MKKVNLRQALEELKKAKNLAQGLVATSNLVNQTAYKAGQFLYGTAANQPKNNLEKTKPLPLSVGRILKPNHLKKTSKS